MTYKSLPTPAKSNRQVQEYTEAVERGFKSVFVRPSNNGWRVTQVNNQKHIGTYADKTMAVQEAKNRANALSGRSFVFDSAGELVETL